MHLSGRHEAAGAIARVVEKHEVFVFVVPRRLIVAAFGAYKE